MQKRRQNAILPKPKYAYHFPCLQLIPITRSWSPDPRLPLPDLFSASQCIPFDRLTST